MARGTLSGAIWGVVVGGIGVTAASIIAPQPAGNTPPAPPQVAAPETDPIIITEPAPAEPTSATEETSIASAPQVSAPETGEVGQIADTTPAERPLALDLNDTLTAPDAGAAPAIETAPVAPVLPNPQSVAPQVPENEGDLVIATAPPEPVVVEEPAPVVTEDPVAETPVEVEDPVAVDPVVVTDAAPEPSETPDAVEQEPEAAPVADESATVAEVVDVPIEAPVAAEDVATAPTAEVETAPEVAVETAPEAGIETVEAEAPSPAETTSPSDIIVGEEVAAAEPQEAAPEAQVEDAGPALTAPTPEEAPTLETPEQEDAPVVVSIIDQPSGLPQGSGGVTIRRIGGTDDAPAESDTPAEKEAVVDPDAPAISRYATAFENPEGKPLMAMLVLDDPDFAEGPRALAEVPFPVTIVIDATRAGATDRMAAYRAAGVEVAATATLPDGAQASDVAVTLEAAFASLSETVAFVDAGDSDVQSDRAVSEMAIATLSEDGRGLVSISRGLNTGLRNAEAAGVPVAEIARDLDGDGQDARVIRRFMERAAFEARQGGGVVLLARLRADTLSALILWGTANRAGQVAMAPLSAVLLAE